MGAQSFELPPMPQWLARQVHYERYVNDGSPNRMSFVNAPSPALSPRLGLPSVTIPLIRAEGSELSPVGRTESSELVQFCLEEGCFPIHPDALGYHFQDSRQFEVRAMLQTVPSASGRTLLSWDGDDFKWLKLSFPGVLGRFRSPLDEEKVNHSIEASRVLNKPMAPPTLAEPVGMTVRLGSGSELFGMSFLMRATTPRYFDPTEHELLPFFSLLAGEADDHKDLAALLSNSSRASVDELFEDLVLPILEVYWCASLTIGMIPEAHPQNLLIQVSGEGHKVVLRDMQGFIADREFLRSPNDHIVTPPLSSLRRERSRRYDDYLSRYVLLPLLIALQERRRFSWDGIFRLIREYVKEKAPEDYFESECQWYEMPFDQVQFERRIEYVRRRGRPLFR